MRFVKAAAVQRSPVLYSREGTVDKVLRKIHELGQEGVQFMMFDKPVSDPTATLQWVGQGVKGRFCAESQPDGRNTGFTHFHRTKTPLPEIRQCMVRKARKGTD